ncbi:RBBP9/YdeN family alpha/beta hydrolase [Streptomyces griseochromogenes]|uniref:RBBP9/YdeN family alpha/beta hydrolase n=1 Tax=Streptomyces griseochromogenes TaxID=68214 RepID=UPI00378C36A5
MSTTIVSHGFGMTNQDHWYPYLRDELGAAGHRVRVPQLPEPQAPQADAWLKALTAETAVSPAADTVLVGHSLGGVNVLRLLEKHDVDAEGPYAGVVLVASMAGEVGYDALAGFFEPDFEWPRIRRAARTFRILHAADDPVTGAATGEHIMRFVTELGATATVTATDGHFPSTGASRLQLPEAIRLVNDSVPNCPGIDEREPGAVCLPP